MAIGFTATNVLTQIVPDKALGRSSTANVRTAKFGDGYEQRQAMGINSISEDITLTLMNRSKAEVDDIIAFFEAKQGTTSFNFTVPDTNSTSITTGQSSGSPTGNTTLTLTTPNLDISTGSVVTDEGSEVSGAVTVSGVNGAVLTLSTAQSIANNTALTFTNPNERTFKVTCAQWNVSYSSNDFYTISTSFKKVFET